MREIRTMKSGKLVSVKYITFDPGVLEWAKIAALRSAQAAGFITEADLADVTVEVVKTDAERITELEQKIEQLVSRE